MDKLTMAHEYAIVMAKQGVPLRICKEIGWEYADAMQAEADKRNYSEKQDSSEWQPDWSQAPKGSDAWRMYGDGNCAWLVDIDGDFKWWAPAPSFDYQGDWKDSLRERPQ